MARDFNEYEITKAIARRARLVKFFTKYAPFIVFVFLKIISPFMRKARWYNSPVRYLWAAGGAGRRSYSSVKQFRWGMETLMEYLNRHLDAIKNNKPVVWIEWNITPEPIHAFGLPPVTPEWTVALAPLRRAWEAVRLIELAEKEGVAEDLCSASKCAEGSAIAKQFPKPVAIITSTQPCDSVQAIYQSLARREGIPHFCLDTPYSREEEDFQYMADNIKRMISYLEERIGMKMDYNKFRSVLEETNKTNYYLSEISEMNRAKPCPSTLMDSLLIWALNTVMMGDPKCTKLAKGLYEQTKKNYEAGKASGPNPERIRIVWHDVPIVFMFIMDWLEKKFGAYIVADMIGYKNMQQVDTTNEETMLRGLADIYMNVAMGRHFHSDMDLYLNELDTFVEIYEPHCLIFTLHRGCKQSWALKNVLKQKGLGYNLPTLIIDADIFDMRYKDEQTIKDQIEDFFINSGLV